MNLSRRTILKSVASLAPMIWLPKTMAANETSPSKDKLEEILHTPVLDLSSFKDPVVISSIELYKNGREHYIKTTSKDGAVGYGITNNRANYLYPVLDELVIPYFVGKDARDIESLMDGVYLYKSNYKISNLALWCCAAWVEFSILDLLAKMKGVPMQHLFGGILYEELPVYYASGNRQTTPQEEADILQRKVDEFGVNAIKFKVGARMRNNADSLPGRTEKLIPLVRKTLGDDITIHADSNGSYDCRKAIEVGRMLEDIDAHFFEEPCPFDHYDETKCVADALTIPVAGGEVESSQRLFRRMIAENIVQVVQPDLHYYGGFIRSRRVANMANAAGMPITLHMGGSGVGFVEMLLFASCTPNRGAFQEFKGGLDHKGKWYDPPLRMKDGAINAPTAPGLGLSNDFDLFQDGERIVSQGI